MQKWQNRESSFGSYMQCPSINDASDFRKRSKDFCQVCVYLILINSDHLAFVPKNFQLKILTILVSCFPGYIYIIKVYFIFLIFLHLPTLSFHELDVHKEKLLILLSSIMSWNMINKSGIKSVFLWTSSFILSHSLSNQ